MADVCWNHYPLVALQSEGRSWLIIQANLGLAASTLEAYGRALQDYFGFCASRTVEPIAAHQEHVARYVREMSQRPRGEKIGLSNATMRQRITVVRLYYDYLVEEGLRERNPVRRGQYTPGRGFGGARDRGFLPYYRRLPWMPDDDQWLAVLETARQEPVRNKVMLALAYDSALRREELCALQVEDIDPARRLLHIRAETTKNRQARVVPYSSATAELFAAYVAHRRHISRARGPLFLSESLRNQGQPVTIWTWSKVVSGIARRAGIQAFTTHTPRHLCLTDLARAGWDIHEIAQFAGHRSIQSTLTYIHLSGRDLAARLESSLSTAHMARVVTMSEMLA